MSTKHSRAMIRVNKFMRFSAFATMSSMLATGCLPRNFWGDTVGGALSSIITAPANGIAAAITAFWTRLLGG